MKMLAYYVAWLSWQAVYIFGHTLIFTKASITNHFTHYWCEIEILFHFGSVALISKSTGHDPFNLKSCFGALLSCLSVYYYDKRCSASFQNVLFNCPNSDYLPHTVVWATAISFVLGNCIQRNFQLQNMWMRLFLILVLILQETQFDQERRVMIFLGYRILFAAIVFTQVPPEVESSKKIA